MEEDAEAFPPLVVLALFPHALEAFRRWRFIFADEVSDNKEEEQIDSSASSLVDTSSSPEGEAVRSAACLTLAIMVAVPLPEVIALQSN